MNYDAIMIGAGFAGAVCARRLAEEGKQVLVLETRNHIGGNAYDCLDAAGVLIHQYGPHIFHTADKRVFDFLSRFTDWNGYHHEVVANVHGDMVPVPFNLVSLHKVFPAEQAAALEEKLLGRFGRDAKVPILQLRESDDAELRALADYVYENVFVTYTMKQWGLKPEEIDPNTTARVPVFVGTDCGYFTDPYQGLPTEGYTAIFERMLAHENITVELGTPAQSRMCFAEGTITLDGAPFTGTVVYTGAVDELFDCHFGRLPYRALDFAFETLDTDFFQTHGTVNYTVSEAYTRITEFKHMTLQNIPGKTTTCKEFSRAYTGEHGDIPYYAIINDENNALYEQYRALADEFVNLHLLGRLAEYRYYNMDAIVACALALCDTLGKDYHS